MVAKPRDSKTGDARATAASDLARKEQCSALCGMTGRSWSLLLLNAAIKSCDVVRISAVCARYGTVTVACQQTSPGSLTTFPSLSVMTTSDVHLP